MGQHVTIQKSPLEDFVDAVLPADRLDDLRRSLPSHIRAEMFQRNLLNAVMVNTDLMDMDTGEVFREVSKAAALGLYLDQQLGEAYIIVGYDGKLKRKAPQLRVGYRGLVKLARQSGEVAQIYAHEVCKNDKFSCEMGTHKALDHKPDVFGERGPIIGYYAVVKYRDGTDDFEPMALADVLAIRDRSDAYKAYKADKVKSTPWSTDEVEMSKKTVVRRLTKRLPQSPELAEAIKIEDRAEFPSFLEERAAPAPRRIAPPPPAMQQIERQTAAPAAEEKPKQQGPYHRGMSVLLTEGRAAAAGGRGDFDAWYNALPPAEQSEIKGHMPGLTKTANEANRASAAPRRAPPPPADSPAAPSIDIGKLQEQFADALAFSDSEDSANAAYTLLIGPVENDLTRDELEALLQMLRNRCGELVP